MQIVSLAPRSGTSVSMRLEVFQNGAERAGTDHKLILEDGSGDLFYINESYLRGYDLIQPARSRSTSRRDSPIPQ